jgi:hypothetical protein
MTDDQEVRLAGAEAEPLNPRDQAGWDAVRAHVADFAVAVTLDDAEGFAAAIAAVRQTTVDLSRVLDALHVPADAGELAPALERILRRIPDGWGRWISCGPGWYPILVHLDTQLAAIDPGYVVHQVKEKFGGLRYYAEPSPPRCCQAWEGTRPPDPKDDRAGHEWDQAHVAHWDSPEHTTAPAARQAAMDAEIARAEAEAAVTCELTGAPGRLMVTTSGWYRTLAPDVGQDKGYRAVER